jgi:hypothetical protein
MDFQDENKNTANESIGPDFDQSKGMMGMKGKQQFGGQTGFAQQGKVNSDNPEPGTHHGVFPAPGQHNLRQYGEHHWDIQGGRPKDLHKDQEHHDVDNLPQGGPSAADFRGHSVPGSYDKGLENTGIHHGSAQEGLRDPFVPDRQRSGMHDVTEELRTRAERGEFAMKEGKNWMASKEQSGV